MKVKGTKRAVAVFLDEGEAHEVSASRFNGQSPASFALATADAEGLPYALITRGTQVRLYAARPDAGVGRKGRTETFVELNTALVTDQTAPLLTLLFGPDALVDRGTFEQILDESHRYASDVGSRLRDRVYGEAVPYLAMAIARHQAGAITTVPAEGELRFYYEQAMLVLFRILFVAYAEDRDLLPYRTNGEYQHNSLKRMAERLATRANEAGDAGVSYDPHSSDLWQDVRKLWDAVANGNQDWRVPAYDGGLFDDDPTYRPAAARLAVTELSNSEFGPALAAMLVDTTPEGRGPIDFRNLSVREFGTIYEGLLESELGHADQDLAVDRQGSYIPATPGEAVSVRKGNFYLHDRSGARKSSGSYFTKPFAVEHLLDHSLEPALADHLARIEKLLDRGDEAGAADTFFDFRCADIAMGSGHFLVAAVDRIERHLANFLSRKRVAGVTRELEGLRQAAIGSLGELAETYEIEDSSLLRRQIARRCIYGVDLNPIAVELARLSIWIHTFVPGLPLSFLDRTLVCGDSLTGIGTLEELEDTFQVDRATTKPGVRDMIWQQVEQQLKAASQPLERLARVAESTVAQVKEAQAEYLSALKEAAPAAALMDLGVAVRNGLAARPAHADLDRLSTEPGMGPAADFARQLKPIHFPARFPEVFVGHRPGFDCLVGNPPWEELNVDERAYWARHDPGLRGLTSAGQIARMETLRNEYQSRAAKLDQSKIHVQSLSRVLASGPFGSGAGKIDLYKVFAWRFWQLAREDGAIGVVLPRSALAGKGMGEWRKTVIEEGAFTDTTLVTNRGYWVFDDMEARYTISLTAVRRGVGHGGRVSTRGPFNSLSEFKEGLKAGPAVFGTAQLREWGDDLSFPLIPSAEAGRVYSKMRQQPRFDSTRHQWRARPIQGDFNATTNKKLFVFSDFEPEGAWPLYGGESFNLWEPDTGARYAWIDPDIAVSHLQEKRTNQAGTRSSAFFGMPEQWLANPGTLPINGHRIAFRDVARATDSRTVICALVPPRVGLVHLAPYLLVRGTDQDVAFLLGVLSSIPFDWAARRVVETHVSFFVLNSLPVPLVGRDSAMRQKLEGTAARLAAPDRRFARWGKALGVEVGSVKSDEEQFELLCEIDAIVARLYGLTEADVRMIFETFHIGWDFEARLGAVLDHFRKLR
jgi:hypothetical protein